MSVLSAGQWFRFREPLAPGEPNGYCYAEKIYRAGNGRVCVMATQFFDDDNRSRCVDVALTGRADKFVRRVDIVTDPELVALLVLAHPM